jgi:hypothetical protein
MWGALIAALVLVAFLYAQRKHYEFLERKDQLNSKLGIESDLSESLKEFTEYKKSV